MRCMNTMRGGFCANRATRWTWAICWKRTMASCVSANTSVSSLPSGFCPKSEQPAGPLPAEPEAAGQSTAT